MAKTNRNWTSAALVAAAFISSGVSYVELPDPAPVNWDAVLLPKDLSSSGPFISRPALALGLPLVALGMLLLMHALKTRGGERFTRWLFGSLISTEADDEFSVRTFEKTYDLMTTLLISMVVLIHFMALAFALEAGRPMGRIFLMALGALFAAIGNYFPRVRPNPVMGFRTARTLGDRTLWARAHRLFGAMVFGTGVAVLVLAFTAFEFGLLAAIAGLALSVIVVAVFVHMPRRVGTSGAIALLLSSTTAGAQAPDMTLAADVDAFVQQLASVARIPGVAVVVVQGDRPVLVKGYGFADVERQIPVTEHTVFYIGSMTKAFTALTAAIMAEHEVVDLDAPIARYLRGVRWADGIRTDSISLRQLLSHTHGIAGGKSTPVVWRTAFTGEQSPALIKELLRYHEANGTRGEFRYTNLGYNIAGLVIDEVSGTRWQDAVARYVTEPLEMKNTTAHVSRFDSARLAMPYHLAPGGPKREFYAKKDANMHAAGGLVSTAADLAKWIEVQINQGRLRGTQVIPERVIAETHRLHVGVPPQRGEMQQIGYGLGWMVRTLNGDTVLQHDGGFGTFRSVMALSPKHGVGVAVLTSEDVLGGGLIEIIAQYVLERAADASAAQAKYGRRLQDVPAIVSRIEAGVADQSARRAVRQQTLVQPLEAFTGTFENPHDGTMTWTVHAGRLSIEMGVLKSMVEVYDVQANEFRAELEPGVGEVFAFRFKDGRAVGVVYRNREFVRR